MDTMAGVVQSVASLLAAAGVTEPRREAIRLVADLAGLPAGEVLLRPDRLVDQALRGRIQVASARRAAGEPLAYVSGVAGFRQLTLAVDRRVLIPRPETEGLVQLVLDAARTGVVVDVGSGSGCIALSLAREGNYRRIIAVDRSRDALAVASDNARASGCRIDLVRGDLLGAVGAARVDVVVSNPPYLTSGEWVGLDRSVRDWEPSVALESGTDGLDATRRLLQEARTILVPGGLLALELDHSRAAQVAAMARRAEWRDVAVTQDLFGRDRYLTARRGLPS